MNKTFISFEMLDGTVHSDHRVLAADKVRAEGICRDNGWPLEDGPRLAVAITYATAKRLDLTAAANVAGFMDELADYELRADEVSMESDPS